MSRAKIILKTKKDQSLRRRHPWVFSGAIKKMEGNVSNGDIVEVYSNHDELLGTGHYSEGSIAVRLFSFGNEQLLEDFWKRKLEEAFELRKLLGLVDSKETNCYRLVHAEGDGLPGLIIDHYDGVLVVQTHSVGMHLLKSQISEALQALYGSELKAIYDKSSASMSKNNGYESINEYLFGDHEGRAICLEHGYKIWVDWVKGQKTGFFIDQRENRGLLGTYSQGKKVLNTFCYTGGFSISALQAGAELVHSLDSSQKALDVTEENVELGGFDPERHACIKADAVEYIKDVKNEYDIIILDPPAFAKHISARHKAVQGYKRINAHAMRQIKSGGLIFTFSCSQAVNKQLFNNTIAAAAISEGRKIKVLHQLHQPADHPVSVYHPEGEYLKGLVLQVI